MEKKKITKEDILEYLEVINSYNDMIESFQLWEDICDNMNYEKSEEYDLNDSSEKSEEREKIIKEKVSEGKEMAKQGIQNIMKNITTISSFISNLSDIQKYISKIDEVILYASDEVKETQEYKLLVNKLDIIKLNIQLKTVKLNQWTNKSKIKILELLNSEKMSGVVGGVYMAYISVLKSLLTVLDKINIAIKQVISAIPDNMKINGEGMSFFLTPKHFSGGTKIPITNMNKSAGDYLNDAVESGINELLDNPKVMNIASKGAFVGERITEASSKLSVGGSSIKVPEINVSDIQLKLTKAVDAIISLIPSAQPLPKYEKLNMANIGYDLWLMTGWCRAGQVAFGMPGQIPGVEATEAEV